MLATFCTLDYPQPIGFEMTGMCHHTWLYVVLGMELGVSSMLGKCSAG